MEVPPATTVASTASRPPACPRPASARDLLNSNDVANHLTYYFRKEFTYTGSTDAGVNVTIDMINDDGATFYLNGTPIGGRGVSAAPTGKRPANRTVADATEELGRRHDHRRQPRHRHQHPRRRSPPDERQQLGLRLRRPAQHLRAERAQHRHQRGAARRRRQRLRRVLQPDRLRPSTSVATTSATPGQPDQIPDPGRPEHPRVRASPRSDSPNPASRSATRPSSTSPSRMAPRWSMRSTPRCRSTAARSGASQTAAAAGSCSANPTRDNANSSSAAGSLAGILTMSEISFGTGTTTPTSSSCTTAGHATLNLAGLSLASHPELQRQGRARRQHRRRVATPASTCPFPGRALHAIPDRLRRTTSSPPPSIAARGRPRFDAGLSRRGRTEWFSAVSPTRDAANNPNRNDDIVINEIMDDTPCGTPPRRIHRALQPWRMPPSTSPQLAIRRWGRLHLPARDDSSPPAASSSSPPIRAYIADSYGGIPVVGDFSGELAEGGELLPPRGRLGQPRRRGPLHAERRLARARRRRRIQPGAAPPGHGQLRSRAPGPTATRATKSTMKHFSFTDQYLRTTAQGGVRPTTRSSTSTSSVTPTSSSRTSRCARMAPATSSPEWQHGPATDGNARPLAGSARAPTDASDIVGGEAPSHLRRPRRQQGEPLRDRRHRDERQRQPDLHLRGPLDLRQAHTGGDTPGTARSATSSSSRCRPTSAARRRQFGALLGLPGPTVSELRHSPPSRPPPIQSSSPPALTPPTRSARSTSSTGRTAAAEQRRLAAPPR